MEPQRKRLNLVIAVVAVALVIIIPSTYSYYISTHKPPVITTNNNSASDTMMFSFHYHNISQDSATFNSYNATSTLNENGIPYATLQSTMKGNAIAIGNRPNAFMIYLVLNISGKISYGLKPSGLTISVESLSGTQSPFTAYIRDALMQVDYMSTYRKPVNVTSTSTSDQNLNLKFLNYTGLQKNQTFHFSLTNIISTVGVWDNALQYNTTYGLSITTSLQGLPKPVSTTLYIYFINLKT